MSEEARNSEQVGTSSATAEEATQVITAFGTLAGAVSGFYFAGRNTKGGATTDESKKSPEKGEVEKKMGA